MLGKLWSLWILIGRFCFHLSDDPGQEAKAVYEINTGMEQKPIKASAQSN